MDKVRRLIFAIILILLIAVTGGLIGGYSDLVGQQLHKNQILFHTEGKNASCGVSVILPANKSIVIASRIKGAGLITYNYTMPSTNFSYIRQTVSQAGGKNPFYVDIVDFTTINTGNCSIELEMNKNMEWEIFLYQDLYAQDVRFFESNEFFFLMLLITPLTGLVIIAIILAPISGKRNV